MLSSGLGRKLHLRNPLHLSTRWVQFLNCPPTKQKSTNPDQQSGKKLGRAWIRARGRWVRSVNTTSVLALRFRTNYLLIGAQLLISCLSNTLRVKAQWWDMMINKLISRMQKEEFILHGNWFGILVPCNTLPGNFSPLQVYAAHCKSTPYKRLCWMRIPTCQASWVN